MSGFLTEIDGTKVYSDKGLKSIDGNRVYFTDGSWCDVCSRKVVNSGPGYISFDDPEEEAKEEKIVTETNIYQGSVLIVNGVRATLVVEVNSEPGIEVTIEGKSRQVKEIVVSEEDGRVLIQPKRSSSDGGITFISGGGNHVTRIFGQGNVFSGGDVVMDGSGSIFSGGNVINFGGGSIVVTGGEEGLVPRISVKVPKGTAIEVAEHRGGSITIGDIEGSVRLSLSGSNHAKVGSVTKTRLEITGSSSITIARVAGALKADLSGASHLEVQSGTIGELSLDVSGASQVTIQAKAEEADLEASGASMIYVSKVTSRPRRSRSGASQITVGNWSA